MVIEGFIGVRSRVDKRRTDFNAASASARFASSSSVRSIAAMRSSSVQSVKSAIELASGPECKRDLTAFELVYDTIANWSILVANGK